MVTQARKLELCLGNERPRDVLAAEIKKPGIAAGLSISGLNAGLLSRMKQGEVNRNANHGNAYSPIIFPGYSLGDIGLRRRVRKCLI